MLFGDLIAGSQFYQVHTLPMEIDVRLSTSIAFLHFLEVLGSLFLAHVLHLQPSHLEVEGILALQHGSFSDWSCHDKQVFKLL